LCTECVSNVDETLGEMFLVEKTPTEDDIRVCHIDTHTHIHLTAFFPWQPG